jgi:magnesium transporter
MVFPEWCYGVILIIIGSLGNNLGNNLVSLGHKETGDKKKNERDTKNKNPATVVPCDDENFGDDMESGKRNEKQANDSSKKLSEKSNGGEDASKEYKWRTIGTTIFVVGNLFTFASFGFGAQSLIAALESIQFVSNVFFVKYVHKSPITHRMSLSTLSIVAGNILVVIFASHAAGLIDSDSMIHLYVTNTAYHVYMSLAFVTWVVTTYIFRVYYHSRVVLEQPLRWKHNFLEPFCYAVSSAILGTQAVLNSKCMSMLLQVTFRGGKNEFKDWYLYFILVTWLLLVSYWLHRLDKGLLLYPPLFIIPIMQVFFVVFAILCGGE